MKDLLNDEEVKSLMSAIERRYGLDFTNYEIKSLKRGLTRLMMKHKMKSILDLWSIVLRDPQFFQESIDDLMVNLTELFRNPEAWIMIRDEILPKFKTKSQLKVWHAGCSTGEEIYTMAIVLKELNMLQSTLARATDLSSRALVKARKGEYSLMVMKQYLKPFLKFYPDREISDYFDYNDFTAIVKPELQKHVEYERHNLVQDEMTEQFDIIFCRNVMIYFDEPLKIKVMNMFNRCLKPGGFFVIGYYDTVPDSGRNIFSVYDSKTRIYVKKPI